MKFYEALETIANEFGEEVLTDPKVLNMLADYNAYEEGRVLRLIYKTLLQEGFIDTLLDIDDWEYEIPGLISDIIDETSFDAKLVTYVVESLGYALALSVDEPSLSTDDELSPDTSVSQTYESDNTSVPSNLVEERAAYGSLTLFNLPISGDARNFASFMMQMGYSLDEELEDGSFELSGVFGGIPNCKLTVFNSPYLFELFKITIETPQIQNKEKLHKTYTTFADLYIRQYGEPSSQSDFKEFTSTSFQFSDGALWIMISGDQVFIIYHGAIEEAHCELEQQAMNLQFGPLNNPDCYAEEDEEEDDDSYYN